MRLERFMKALLGITSTLVICVSLCCCASSRSDPKETRTAEVSTSPEQTHLPGNSVTCRFQELGGSSIPVVPVYVNGQGPFLFVLDTGSTGLMLSPKTLSSIGSAPPVGKRISLITPAGTQSIGPLRHISKITLGTAKFYNVNTTVFNLDGLTTIFGQEIAGVLGLRVFAGCRLTINYPDRIIAMESLKDVQPLSMSGEDLLRLKTVGKDLVAIPLRINKQTIWCMIDSGLDQGISVPNTIAADLPLANEPVRVPFSTMTFLGVIPYSMARVKASATIGEHELVNPTLAIKGKRPGFSGGTTFSPDKFV